VNRVERRVRDMINRTRRRSPSDGVIPPGTGACLARSVATRPPLARACPGLRFLVWAAEYRRVWVLSPLRLPAGAKPGERVPCLGSAKPIACDATARERPRRGGRERDNGSPGRRHSAAPVASLGEPD
jgi:hypothetical protein